jgi:hypothetical protein
METQAQPASPQMWDPALVEGAMQSLGRAEASRQSRSSNNITWT